MNEPPLPERVRASGYTPRARDLAAVIALLSEADDDLARQAGRALARAGAPAAELAMATFESAPAKARPRLVEVVGRVATAVGGPELRAFIEAKTRDPDPRTRRRAVTALGRIAGPEAEGVLLEAWDASPLAPERKAVATSLGKIGTRRSLDLLRALCTDDAELARVAREAALQIERRLVRDAPGALSTIDGKARPGGALPVLLHVRAGLEELLVSELGGFRPRVVGRGRVEVRLTGPLDGLFHARTFLHLGFPLTPSVVEGGDVISAVASALTSDGAREIFTTFTRGTIRYRLEWRDAGRSRAATFQVAERVLARDAALVNDPTRALWEAVVTVRSERVYVELWPRALEDPRFLYRKSTVPASSHPTVAAALARVSGVRPDDVVWDPFVGAGLELVERALLGPYARLLGTDLDLRALAAARENLKAAGISDAELSQADARTYRPSVAPTLVVTNPPFGRRVLRRDAIAPLFRAFLDNVARVLADGGRLVWVSPLPEATRAFAEEHGFALASALRLDLGGPTGELQHFERRAGVHPPGRKRRRGR